MTEHPLITDAGNLEATNQQYLADIEKLRENDIYSAEHREKMAAAKETERLNTLDSRQAKMVAAVQTEFDNLTQKRQEILHQNRLSDELLQGNGLQAATVELQALAETSDSFDDFVRRYQATDDAFLKRAFQISGAALAKQRWPHTPAIGSFSRQLERDRASSVENDASLEIIAQMKRLYPGAVAVSNTARRLYREGVGMRSFESTPADSYFARADNLQRQIYAEISPFLETQSNPDANFHGGLYTPGALNIRQAG